MDIKQIIKDNGGIFIEELKIDGRKHIKFTCENGHESVKRNDTFKKTWCNICQNNTIVDVHKLANKRGFKFLSEEYNNSKTSYLWQCSEGHQWKARYYNIYSGRGCPECLRVPYSYFFDKITEKGGKVVTTKEEYVSVTSRIKFICEDGHECDTTGSLLRSGKWCAECQCSLCERTCRNIFEHIFQAPFSKSRHLKNPVTNKGIELDGYNEDLKLAFEYNGKQHYERVNYWQRTENCLEKQKERDVIKKELCEKHEIKLIIIPYTVEYKDLYTFIINNFPERNFEKNIDISTFSVESYGKSRLNDIRELIKKYNGKLITETYINNYTKMDFICENGHEFQNTLGVIQQGTFCKKCSNDKTSNRTLPLIEKFCDKSDYELLDVYKRAKVKCNWKCKQCEKIIITSWDSIRTRLKHSCHK